jgi:flagellar protein FlgJ
MLPPSNGLPGAADGADGIVQKVEISRARAREGGRAERARSAREAARLLEGLFFRQLVKEMRRSVPRGGLMGGSMDQQVFTEMMDGAIADEAGKTGSLGLADALERHLLAQMAPAPARQIAPMSGAAVSRRAKETLAAAEGAQKYRFEPPRRPESVALIDGDGGFTSPLAGPLPRVDGERSIAAAPGAVVVASASGTVVSAGAGHLIVDHGQGTYTRYTQLGPSLAQRGDLVLRGQTIGRVGPSGRLGFDIRRAGRILTPTEINAEILAPESPGGTPEPGRQ